MVRGLFAAACRLCARRRGDCIGMAAAGCVFLSVPAHADGEAVFYNIGTCMLALGLAATAAGLAGGRA